MTGTFLVGISVFDWGGLELGLRLVDKAKFDGLVFFGFCGNVVCCSFLGLWTRVSDEQAFLIPVSRRTPKFSVDGDERGV